jgi:copper(I)-binding protein
MKSLLITTLCALALPVLAVDVTVANAWARATVPGQPVSGAYFDITAKADAKLTKVVAGGNVGSAEVHEMKMDKGMMSMRPIAALPLPAGKTVTLQPNGYHVMLMDLKGPLKAGDKVPLVLTVEAGGKAQQVKVDATVKGQ